MFVNNYAPVGAYRPAPDMIRDIGADLAMNHQLPHDFIGVRRPFIDDNGQRCVIVNTGRWTTEKGERKPIRQKHRIVDLLNRGYPINPLTLNATTLRKEDWIEMDRKVLLAAREPLVAWADLAAANTFGGFNAYGRMTLEYEAMSDPGEAVVDMDGLTAGRTDNPLFKLRSMPLPITHSDFWYSDRRLEVSGNSGTPLDTVSAEAAARRVAETIEDTTIGNTTGITYGTIASGNYASHDGTSTIYGYTNFTYRATKTNLTTPTGSNPQSTVADVLDMLQTMAQNKYYGPFILYCSLAWKEYLGNDYLFTNGSNYAATPSKTLLQRLQDLKPDIQDVRVLPRISTAGSFVMILVQMTSNVAEAVDGQPITTLQWDSVGGLRKNFKVWCIQAPRLRADYNAVTTGAGTGAGILHATTS